MIIMNRKALILAGVFLAVILAFPIYALVTTAADEKDIAGSGSSPADVSEIQEDINALASWHGTLLTVVLALDVVFTILFVVATYYGIKR